MKKPRFPLVLTCAGLALGFAPGAFAQQIDAEQMLTIEEPATVAVPADEGEPRGPALWVVADEDTTIYLFGTIHALPRDVPWANDAITDALHSSDTLVFEVPMDAEGEAAAQQVAIAKGMLSDGTTLRSKLNPEQLTVYEDALTKLGMPTASLDGFKPWMGALTLTMVPLLQSGYSPAEGVEKQLLAIAGPDKETGALETIEYQLGLFDGMPQEQQVDFLIETASTVDEVVPMLDTMKDVWLAGDTDQLAELMNAGFSDPKVAETLLYHRNENWAEWIDQRMQQPGTVFIAVGAGHLAGDRSVQDLLARRHIGTRRVQ